MATKKQAVTQEIPLGAVREAYGQVMGVQRNWGTENSLIVELTHNVEPKYIRFNISDLWRVTEFGYYCPLTPIEMDAGTLKAPYQNQTVQVLAGKFNLRHRVFRVLDSTLLARFRYFDNVCLWVREDWSGLQGWAADQMLQNRKLVLEKQGAIFVEPRHNAVQVCKSGWGIIHAFFPMKALMDAQTIEKYIEIVGSGARTADFAHCGGDTKVRTMTKQMIRQARADELEEQRKREEEEKRRERVAAGYAGIVTG